MTDNVLSQLISMSRLLAEPTRDLVIMGEGNTSARADAETFWVKASGTSLYGIEAGGFVRMRFEPVLSMLKVAGLDDALVKERLIAAKADPTAEEHPSIETMLHALILSLPDVHFVGHTHPIAVNAIMCSRHAEEAIAGRLFPEEVAFCGPAPAYVPYADPGLPLAHQVKDSLARYTGEWGEPPRVVLMQNHGLIALGRTAAEVETVTAMYVKTARVLLGTYALGGPRFLSDRDVRRIHTRPDEVARRRKLT
jgi:rhamnose utilization protein RhaD (predicted bifunctional aldolase and dehydrogenase)